MLNRSDTSCLQLNICADAPGCGSGMGGCELEAGQPLSPVGVQKTLKYSTNGELQLTYRGQLDVQTGTENTLYLTINVK